MLEPALILLAEDEEDHVALIRRAFKQAHLVNPLHAVHDGEETIEYLKGEGKYANRAEYPLPALLLLDLKMPRQNGFEILKWIRQQPGLSSLRVIVLTGSDDLRDARVNDVSIIVGMGLPIRSANLTHGSSASLA